MKKQEVKTLDVYFGNEDIDKILFYSFRDFLEYRLAKQNKKDV